MSKRNYTATVNKAAIQDQRKVFRELTSGVNARLSTLEAEVKALRAELNAQNRRERKLVKVVDSIDVDVNNTNSAVSKLVSNEIKTSQQIKGLEGKIRASESSFRDRLLELLTHIVKIENKLR